jgi:arabinose-5-phosphate isomerase
MTVMQMKGLTPQDFALNHPAGRLGKRLTLRVVDLMHSGSQLPTLAPQASFLDVVLAVGQGSLGAVSVVDVQGFLLGIITDGDIRRSIPKLNAGVLDHLTAGMIMTRDPVVVTPEVLAFDALKLMEERNSQISVLPVVDKENRSLGLLHLHDIVRSGL